MSISAPEAAAAIAEPRPLATRPHLPMRLLLVDDEPGILSAYTRLFRNAGIHVTTASDGAKAMTLIAEGDFDVILSDITMPALNGIEMLALVHGRNTDLPVILMTAGPSLESAVAAVEGGAFRYVFKPIDSDELLATVRLAAATGKETRARRESAAALEALRLAAKNDHDVLDATFDRALGAIQMAFQPIVSCADRRVIAYEALLRSREPGMSRPDQILAAAESLERIAALGRAVRAAVAASFATLPETASMFVNLHPSDLGDDELYDPASPLSAFAPRVVLEITERASLESIADLPERLRLLRSLGYRIAIDDLGAGYSGLKSIAELQPEVVKLDMSLVRDLDVSPTKQKVVASLYMLCKQLGIGVVVEGVETAAERDALLAIGCNTQQGYLFARPAPSFDPAFLDA